MSEVRFLIRRPDSEKQQSVYVSFRFGRNEKLMYATPLKVDAVYWDAARQRVRNTMLCKYRDDVNGKLNDLSTLVGRLLASGEKITKTLLKEELDAFFGKAHPRHLEFHDFFDLYTAECETRMNNRRGGQTVTYKTQREYVRTHYYINEYEKKHKVILTFEDITQTFINSFVGFLQSLNLATNTIAHKVITLKALMRAAVERGLTENTKWQFYRNSTEETESVALNEDELERIRRCNLSRHPHLEDIRDLFLLQCWTGLRFSDVIRLRPEHIHGDYIVIQQQKTNNYVTIPIHPVFREVWERNGGVPLVISNQKFNDHIKRVCKAARIRERVLKSITKGGKKITTQYEKWQLVSSHTGRRSFATNLYKSGFPSISIMQITGHRTEAAFLKYIKVSKGEHAKMLAEHWNKKQKV